MEQLVLSSLDIQMLCLQDLFSDKVISSNFFFGYGWGKDVNTVMCYLLADFLSWKCYYFQNMSLNLLHCSYTNTTRSFEPESTLCTYERRISALLLVVDPNMVRKKAVRSRTCSRSYVFEFDSLCALYITKWRINS